MKTLKVIIALLIFAQSWWMADSAISAMKILDWNFLLFGLIGALKGWALSLFIVYIWLIFQKGEVQR